MTLQGVVAARDTLGEHVGWGGPRAPQEVLSCPGWTWRPKATSDARPPCPFSRLETIGQRLRQGTVRGSAEIGVNGYQELTHLGHEELTHPGVVGAGRAHAVGAVFSCLASPRFPGAGMRSPGPRVTSTSAC